jgi:hypothetical protein
MTLAGWVRTLVSRRSRETEMEVVNKLVATRHGSLAVLTTSAHPSTEVSKTNGDLTFH